MTIKIALYIFTGTWILKLHNHDLTNSKKLQVSQYEAYHFKCLAGHTSKNLASYSIHFKNSQSYSFLSWNSQWNSFVWWLSVDGPSCIRPNRLSPTRFIISSEERRKKAGVMSLSLLIYSFLFPVKKFEKLFSNSATNHQSMQVLSFPQTHGKEKTT